MIVLLVAFGLSSAILIHAYYRSSKGDTKFSTRVFKGANGWGYDIFRGNNLLIHQQYIPALGGKRGFDTKEQATMVANMVLQKLQQNRLPTVTTFEISQIPH